ncbi:hypothetical protein ACA910_016779 [Epithemia clementina (nom. ined.)]
MSGNKSLPPPAPPPPPPLPGTGKEQRSFHYDYSNIDRSRGRSDARSQNLDHVPRTFLGKQVNDAPASNRRQQQRFDHSGHKNNMPKQNFASPPWKRPRQIFRCEQCDIDLDSTSALEAHKASHTSCTLCSFSAAPKVVKAHYQSVHGKFSVSGFKTITVAVPGCPVQRFRICVGNRPEDIQQWIAERKKRYPRMNQPNDEKALGQTMESQTMESRPKIDSFSSLLEGYGSSDSESSKDDEEKPSKSTKSIDEALSSNAAVSSTTEVPSNQVDPVAPTAPPSNQAPSKRDVCRVYARHGRCRRGSSCPFIHDPMCHLAGSSDSSRPASLLRKLLQKEVERESILSIQLLKYIVESDFLKNRLKVSGNHSPS